MMIKLTGQQQFIIVGDHQAICDSGVSQGSLISPMLFNIYTEPLVKTLQDEQKLIPLMYADDLAVICNNEQQIKRAIEITNQWASDNNMIVNASKSGIVQFGLRTRKPRVNDILGIPWLTKYQYLGGMVQSNQRTIQHSKKLNSKVGWITSRLTPIRNLADVRLNINLFKIFIYPLFHQAAASLIFTTEADQQRYQRHYKNSFKKFVCLPRSTSNQMLQLLHESPIDLLKGRIFRAISQISFQQNEIQIFESLPLYQDPKPTVKFVPKCFLSLMRALYINKCKNQDHTAKGRTHYKIEHAISINIMLLLSFYDEHKKLAKNEIGTVHQSRSNHLQQKIIQYKNIILSLTTT